MNPVALIMLSLGVSADAFAVSVSNGLCAKPPIGRERLLCAAFFGFFQGVMPVLGFLAGRGFADVVAKYAQPLASLLLFVLGAKMLFGAFWHHRHAPSVPARLTLGNLLVQSVATSIDALSVGVGLALINSQIPLTALCIASIAFLSCYAGFTLGRRFGVMLAQRAMTAGGILLLLIGLYILLAQHLQGL